VNRKQLLWIVPVGLAAVGIAAAAMRHEEPDVATFVVQPMQFSRRVTAEGTLKAVKATPVTAPANVSQPMKLAWLATDGTLLKQGDVIARFDATEFENLLVSGNEDRATATNKMTKTNTETSSTRTNLRRDARLAQTELDAAKKFKFDDAEVFSRYQRIESEVDQELAGNRKQHAEEVMGVREKLAGADRDLISIEDRKAGLKIKKAEEGLRALQVVAPHDGILVLTRDWRGEVRRVGDTCWPGMPMGEIPELTAMQAEVFVLEADAAGLAVDQKVALTMESNPTQRFTGKVKSVDKIARPRFRNVPVQYFGVTVALDKTDPKTMKPGTRVRAVLEIENMDNAFAVPRQALFDKDGKKIVYRKKGDRYEPVEVTIGSSSAGRVVVTKGLSKGDALALKDPTGDQSEDESTASK
jgi:HlyD family secretion protein